MMTVLIIDIPFCLTSKGGQPIVIHRRIMEIEIMICAIRISIMQNV